MTKREDLVQILQDAKRGCQIPQAVLDELIAMVYVPPPVPQESITIEMNPEPAIGHFVDAHFPPVGEASAEVEAPPEISEPAVEEKSKRKKKSK